MPSTELRVNSDEEKCRKSIQRFRFSHPSCEGQVTGLFWRKAVEAFAKGDFICSVILACVTAELAHKTKLREQGAETRRPDGKSKTWSKLIHRYEKDKEIRRIANEIRDEYRNIWVHPNYE